MNLTVIGAGYVGLATAFGFAALGHNVIVHDVDLRRMSDLTSGKMPFMDPGMQAELLLTPEERKAQGKGQIEFNSRLDDSCVNDIVFVCISTSNMLGGHNINNIEMVLDQVNHQWSKHDWENAVDDNGEYTKRLVVRSTLNIMEMYQLSYHVASNVKLIYNPEFLQEGNALECFMNPARILIGTEYSEPDAVMNELYGPFADRVHYGTHDTVAMAKLGTNAMLAARLAVINALGLYANQSMEVDFDEAMKFITMDPRIGTQYAQPGIGWGGSCLPKDINILGSGPSSLFNDVAFSNKQTTVKWADEIMRYAQHASGDDVVLGIWGITFKANTDDVRLSPAMTFIQHIAETNKKHVTLKIYDPSGVHHRTKMNFKGDNYAIELCDNIHETTVDASCLVLLTDWQEFLDYDPFPALLTVKSKLIFDGRNALDHKKYTDLGFHYRSIGKVARK